MNATCIAVHVEHRVSTAGPHQDAVRTPSKSVHVGGSAGKAPEKVVVGKHEVRNAGRERIDAGEQATVEVKERTHARPQFFTLDYPQDGSILREVEILERDEVEVEGTGAGLPNVNPNYHQRPGIEVVPSGEEAIFGAPYHPGHIRGLRTTMSGLLDNPLSQLYFGMAD